MARKQNKKRKNTAISLHVLQANSAGIDIGATEIYVAVPDGRSNESVRRFDTFTDDLHEAVSGSRSAVLNQSPKNPLPR